MSLRFKMVLGIGVVLSLVILEYALVALRVQRNNEINTARQEAQIVSGVASQAISIAMEQGKSEETQKILERIGRENAVASIRILDPDGTILRSGDPQEIGRREPRSLALGGAAHETRQAVRDGAVGVARPIENGPACSGCHAAAKDTLGVLAVTVPLAGGASRMAGQVPWMVLAGVAGVAAAGILIALFFSFVVGRRIETLSNTMRLVEAGDLTARVPEGAADELGRVGRGFNEMVARLAEEKRGREDRHAREIHEAEQMAALGRRAAVGTITSGIAHELNNPLNNISITVESLMENFHDLDDEAKWRLLQDTFFEVERASEIVRSLLDFTREETPHMASLDLAELIRSTGRLVENEMKINNVDFSLELPPSLPPVMGAMNQLRQVFLNLFLNAVQAMPGGGVLHVVVHAARDGRVCANIADQGAGITAEALPHIFDPFFTTKEPGAGIGLGLWITYQIVKKHGGDIDVTSRPGGGTTFRVCLPAAPPQPDTGTTAGREEE